MSKALRYSAVLSLVVVLAAALVGVWRVGYTQGEGAFDGARISGLIEYSVRDASGAVKEQRVIHNTTADAFKNAARARLGVAGTTLGASNVDMYSSIRACNNAASSTLCTSTNLTSNVNNPIDAAGAAGGTGVYTATGTFTATGAAGPILTLQLTDRNATDGSRSVGAHQTVNITLASGDTLQVTWTITIS